VPARIDLERPVSSALLGCGAHLKNTFCLAEGRFAWLGPHIGDLETDEACRAFEDTLERFQRFVGIRPAALAHDLHPDYFTTRYALERADHLPRVAVQHHHAHVASCMAEHGLHGEVIGLAWDGTGWGPDGTAWGGETLIASRAAFRRVATFRPLALAGGERAIREVWRCALALLDQAFDGDPPLDRLPLFAQVDAAEVELVRRMIAAGLNAPLAHGVGRLFDAFGAIALARSRARYEGQVAVEMGGIAAAEAPPYPYDIDDAAPAGEILAVDLRPSLRAAVGEILAGAPAAAISSRFHATLVAAGADMVRHAVAGAERLPVVLSGGCFQNPVLVEGLRRRLRGFPIYSHEAVPPGDGGISLGQIAVADAVLG
jgi:hydrogenase maturation protein HypF